MNWPADTLTAIAWQLVAVAAIGLAALIITHPRLRRLWRRGRHFAR